MNDQTVLVPLIDGGIWKIEYDSSFNSGCDTCDYGSSYMNDFKLLMTGGEIKVEVEQMYEFAFSEGYMMKLFLVNLDEIKTMSENSFFLWLENKLKSDLIASYNDAKLIIKFNKE